MASFAQLAGRGCVANDRLLLTQRRAPCSRPLVASMDYLPGCVDHQFRRGQHGTQE